MIQIRAVKTKKELKQFIHLPFQLHKNHKEWLPPLIDDEWKVFDKTKNHSFEHCDTIMLLAEKDGVVVGRIMGIVNHFYNETHEENSVRFGFPDCINDEAVFDALLNEIKAWGKDKGCDKIVGPIGFSDKDPQGFLIEGFDDPMTVMVTSCNYEYMIHHIQRNGFEKKVDLFQYRCPTPESVPAVYTRVSERILQRGFSILEFTKTRQIRPFIQPIFELINETYTDIYGFAPLTEIEAKEFSERFLPLLNPGFIKVVLDREEKPAAFVVGMPDISKGFKRAKGRLFPFGFIHILLSLRTSKQLNLLLGCIKTKYQNSGLDALMAVSMLEAAIKGKLNVLDSHLVMEDNVKMRAIYERLNGEVYKKYRIFEKSL